MKALSGRTKATSLIVAGVLTLAACGGGSSGNSDSSGTGSSNEGSAAGSNSDGGTIRVLEFYTQSDNAANVEFLDMVSDIFREENSGWDVEYESSTWDQIDQKSILDMEAKVSHDVMLVSPQLMAKHGQAGDLLDLTEYLNTAYDADQLADLNWSAGWAASAVDGKQLAVPTGTHVRGNMINNEVFAEAGLDPATPMKTPQDMLDAAVKVKESGAADWGMMGFLGSSRATVEVTYAPLVWAYGGDFWEDDKPALTSDASIQAVEYLWDAVNEYKVIPPFAYAADADYDGLVKDSLLDGTVSQSMGFGSYWIAAVEEAGLTKDCFPATAECTNDGATAVLMPGPTGAGFGNSWNLAVHSLSEQPDMAWKWIEIALRPENIVKYPDAGLPPWLSIYESDAYSSDYWQVWRKMAESARPMPSTPYYPELADATFAAIQTAMASDRSEIPSIMEKAQDDFTAAYLK